jgi:hypothetical protein
MSVAQKGKKIASLLDLMALASRELDLPADLRSTVANREGARRECWTYLASSSRRCSHATRGDCHSELGRFIV